MKRRIAEKMIKAVNDYRNFRRLGMPYNGNQIYKAAIVAKIPLCLRHRYKGWHKESKEEDQLNLFKML